MPSQQRRDEVCSTEDIEASGEDTAGYAVGDGCVPRHLGLVYRQVGGDGAVQPLSGKDGVGIGRFCGLCLGVGFCGGGLEGNGPGSGGALAAFKVVCLPFEKHAEGVVSLEGSYCEGYTGLGVAICSLQWPLAG